MTTSDETQHEPPPRDVTDELSEIRATNQMIADGIKAVVDRLDLAETSQTQLKIQARKNRTTSRVAFAGVMLDITLTVILGLIYHRIDVIQQTTSSQVLCPLYTILNSSLDQDLNHDGIITAKERATWALASKDANHDGQVDTDEESRFQISALAIRNGFAALHCS